MMLFHNAMVNVQQTVSTRCGLCLVCVQIELLSTYFKLPQLSFVLVKFVSFIYLIFVNVCVSVCLFVSYL